MADLPRDAKRAARTRNAARAADVIDRAARMKQFKAPLVERINRRSERHHEIPSSSGKPNADRHERHSQ